jgi:hypothetical protein
MEVNEVMQQFVEEDVDSLSLIDFPALLRWGVVSVS